MKHKEFPYLKRFTRKAFQSAFTKILWHRELSYGAKIYALALLTVPPQSKVKVKRIAYKLGTYPSALSRWRKEQEKLNMTIRPLIPIFSEKK